MSLEQDLQAYERITSVQNLSGYDKKPGDVYKEILEKLGIEDKIKEIEEKEKKKK